MTPNLFYSHFAFLRTEATTIPFSVGGVTQFGVHVEPQNNQDAMGLDIDNAAIIAVVCDGCGGASSLGQNSVSLNESGAHLTCLITLNAVRQIINKGMTCDKPELFVSQLSTRIERHIRRLSVLGGRSRRSREYVLTEFLTTTILCAVVTQTEYLVFGAGDGIVGINDVMTLREDHEGEYLVNDMVLALRQHGPQGEQRPSLLRCLGSGRADELRNIILATDGVYELVNGRTNPISLALRTTNREVTPGYDRLFFREFRTQVVASLMQTHGQLFTGVHDDRTLVMVRRADNVTAGQHEEKESHAHNH